MNINPYRLKVSQLRALVAIADEGTFGKAALHLDLSQSAVSHAIATLEEELGVVLLNRGRQGAMLTPTGEQIAEEARQVLEALERIGKTANLARGVQSGQVRVACFRSIATHLLPIVINQLRQNYPAIRITLMEFCSSDDIETALRVGRADVGFILLPPAFDLETEELFRDDYVAFLPPSEKPPKRLGWEQLLRHPLILAPKHVTCYKLVHDYFFRYEQPFQVAYEVTEDSTMLSMVMQGLGVAIMPRLAAHPAPEGIKIADLPEPLERIIGVATVPDALHSPAVYAFLDALTQVRKTWEWQATIQESLVLNCSL